MVEGRAALPLQEEGPFGPALAQDAEGVGVDGAHPVVVPEVAGRPAGRIELDDLPAQQGGLRGERGQEAVDGGGVLDVPEELAEAIREVAQGRLRIPDKSIRRVFALIRGQRGLTASRALKALTDRERDIL